MHLQVDATQPIHIVSDKFISYTFDLSAWATFERYRNFSGARARAHVRVRVLAVQQHVCQSACALLCYAAMLLRVAVRCKLPRGYPPAPSDPAFIAAARGFAPALLRLGGTGGDNTSYDMSSGGGGGGDRARSGIPERVMSKAQWDAMNAFAIAAGWQILFGLNALEVRPCCVAERRCTNPAGLIAGLQPGRCSLRCSAYPNPMP